MKLNQSLNKLQLILEEHAINENEQIQNQIKKKKYKSYVMNVLIKQWKDNETMIKNYSLYRRKNE